MQNYVNCPYMQDFVVEPKHLLLRIDLAYGQLNTTTELFISCVITFSMQLNVANYQ